MKTSLIIALAIGVLISTVLLIMERLTDHALIWLDWQMPGIGAAYLFWGAVGDSVFLGVAIAWFVNALAYGAAAFAVLILFKLLTLALSK